LLVIIAGKEFRKFRCSNYAKCFIVLVPESPDEEHPVQFLTLEIGVDVVSNPLLIQRHRVVDEDRSLIVQDEASHGKVVGSIDNASYNNKNRELSPF